MILIMIIRRGLLRYHIVPHREPAIFHAPRQFALNILKQQHVKIGPLESVDKLDADPALSKHWYKK